MVEKDYVRIKRRYSRSNCRKTGRKSDIEEKFKENKLEITNFGNNVIKGIKKIRENNNIIK